MSSSVEKDYEGSKLDLQRSQWLVVLGKDYIKKDFSTALETLNRSGYTYYGILHDKDTIKDTGVLKYPHYHLVLTTTKRPRASTIINLMCDTFNCPSDNVSVSECLDLVLSIQYLIHKNENLELGKYLYDVKDVVTNDKFNNIDDIMKIKQSKIIPSTDSFIRIIANAKDRVEIIEKLGITHYAYYRSTIDDLIRAMRRFDLLDSSRSIRPSTHV